MNKAEFKYIQRAWKQFDEATAFGCATKNGVFSKVTCDMAWNVYATSLNDYYNRVMFPLREI